jgi:hypothetical protein
LVVSSSDSRSGTSVPTRKVALETTGAAIGVTGAAAAGAWTAGWVGVSGFH